MPSVTLDELDLRILGLLQVNSALSNIELAELAHTSPPTCLRRVHRLRETGVIQREVAILDHSKLGVTLTAIIEVSLDRQTAEEHAHFETLICDEASVTQCYRVSPGPDFIVVADVGNMSEYDELARRLFTGSSNIRNVRTYFSTHRAKFEANAPIRLMVGRVGA